MRGSRRATPGPVHERRLPGEARPRTEGLLDPQQPVVLRDPLAPASGTGLEMSGTDGDGEIGDRADLVELDEDGVRHAFLHTAGDDLRVRTEDVVADELDLPSEPFRQALPAAPVVLGEPVLEEDDRIPGDPVLPQ